MNAQLPITTAASGKPAVRDAFRVVIVYEDYPAGRRAMAAYRRLSPHFDREFDFSVIAWSFKVLRYARLNQEAVQDAANAALGCDLAPPHGSPLISLVAKDG